MAQFKGQEIDPFQRKKEEGFKENLRRDTPQGGFVTLYESLLLIFLLRRI